MVLETDNSGNVQKYLRGNSLIAMENNGVRSYYLHNAHSDVVQLTNTSGQITKDYTYDAFGNEAMPAIGDVNPFRYAGEYIDAETGYQYLRARYYDANVGRFITEDTHWNQGNMIYGDNPDENPMPNINAIRQSSNLYAYAMSNPIMFFDYSGKKVTVKNVSGELTFGPGGRVNVFYAYDDKDNFGLFTSEDFAGGVNVGFAIDEYVFPTMNNIFELTKGTNATLTGNAWRLSKTYIICGEHVGHNSNIGFTSKELKIENVRVKIGGSASITLGTQMIYHSTFTEFNRNAEKVQKDISKAIDQTMNNKKITSTNGTIALYNYIKKIKNN